jgi:hypothetical protein
MNGKAYRAKGRFQNRKGANSTNDGGIGSTRESTAAIEAKKWRMK